MLWVFDPIAAATCMPFLLITEDGLPCNKSELGHCYMNQAKKDYLKVCKPQWVDRQLQPILCQDKDVNISNVIII